MCKLYIVKLNLASGVVGIIVPTTCYDKLMRELVRDDYLLKIILRKTSIIGEVVNVDPILSGLALINEGPYGGDYSYIEFVRGAYIPLSKIRPIQCFLENNEFIGCRVPKQQVYVDCRCRIHDYNSYAISNDPNMKNFVINIVSRLRPILKRRGKCLWLFDGSRLFYWSL